MGGEDPHLLCCSWVEVTVASGALATSLLYIGLCGLLGHSAGSVMQASLEGALTMRLPVQPGPPLGPYDLGTQKFYSTVRALTVL